jgi:alpha-tubulin suppressor-like RCC1 family protein
LNNYGQLGLGNQQLLSGYVDFNGKTTAALSQGNSHFCAILDDGSVSCWGRNNKGQLGDGTNTNQNSPTSVDLGINKTAVSISSGLDFTCALLNTGEVSCWGDNSFGVFASGDTSNSNVPVIVNHSIGERVVSISTPGYSVCAISSTG